MFRETRLAHELAKSLSEVFQPGMCMSIRALTLDPFLSSFLYRPCDYSPSRLLRRQMM